MAVVALGIVSCPLSPLADAEKPMVPAEPDHSNSLELTVDGHPTAWSASQPSKSESHPTMHVERGTVKSWNPDEGWGVLVVPGVADEVWMHFSAIVGADYPTVRVGMSASFDYHATPWPGGVEGYRYMAERVVLLEK